MVGSPLLQTELAEPAGGFVVVDEPLHPAIGEIAGELQDDQAQAALRSGLATAYVRIEDVVVLRETGGCR